jgi:hypothetical protein
VSIYSPKTLQKRSPCVVPRVPGTYLEALKNTISGPFHISRRFLSVETKLPSQDSCVGFLVEKGDSIFDNIHLPLSNIMHPVIRIYLPVVSGKVTGDAVAEW